MVTTGEPSLYDKRMARVYLADSQREERSALRLLLTDLKMKVVGEAADWSTTLAQAPILRTDMLLVEWKLLPNEPNLALEKLREACPAALIIVIISHLDAREQVVLSAGVDAFISKTESPDRVAERLRAIAASILPDRQGGLEEPALRRSANVESNNNGLDWLPPSAS